MSIVTTNVLYHQHIKILREGETGTLEIRFYSSETPNEKYRTGQKTITGKLIAIRPIQQGGYTLSFDISQLYNGSINTFSINEDYITTCKARCIEFRLTGDNEYYYYITVDEWLSSNTYLNNAIIDSKDSNYIFQVGDLVTTEVNLSDSTTKKRIAKIIEIDNMVDTATDAVYYNITLDYSTLYNYEVTTIKSSDIVSIELYEEPDEDVHFGDE